MNEVKLITVTQDHYEAMCKAAVNGAIRVDYLEMALYMVVSSYQGLCEPEPEMMGIIQRWVNYCREHRITHPVQFQSDYTQLNHIKI